VPVTWHFSSYAQKRELGVKLTRGLPKMKATGAVGAVAVAGEEFIHDRRAFACLRAAFKR
jgi:hypothetical protein